MPLLSYRLSALVNVALSTEPHVAGGRGWALWLPRGPEQTGPRGLGDGYIRAGVATPSRTSARNTAIPWPARNTSAIWTRVRAAPAEQANCCDRRDWRELHGVLG